MDSQQMRMLLEEWKGTWTVNLSPATRAVVISLGATQLWEAPGVNLHTPDWSDLPQIAHKAMEQGDIAARAALQHFEQRFQQQPPLAFLAADADQIQAYVFESAKIPEVRGASVLVEWLN